jgi:hypothetical protein
MHTWLICSVAAIAALARIFITPRLANIPTIEGTYEALAHLFVGFLILVRFYDPDEFCAPSKLYFWIGLALALWEAGWFLVQKIGLHA